MLQREVGELAENGINYSTKKTIAQGMMDIALLTANASQLKSLLVAPNWDLNHKVNVSLITISIVCQVKVPAPPQGAVGPPNWKPTDLNELIF